MAPHKQTPSVSFPNDSISYTVPTWADMMDGIFDISQQITASNEQYDVIVTLAKGGLPLSRILADFLHIPIILSLGVRFYTGIRETLDKPEIYQDIYPVSGVAGKKVLLFDDVAETGESLIFGEQYCRALGAESVTTAAVYMKPKTRHIPKHYAFETTDWILFPFEIMESVNQLDSRWQEQGIAAAERQSRFIKIGCKKEWLNQK